MENEKLLADIKTLQSELRTLRHKVSRLEGDLVVKNSLLFGAPNSDISIRMDREGMWIGKRLLDDITGATIDATNGSPSTAILMDGTIYPKGGVTGSYTGTGTLTITRGIITNIA